MAIQIISDGDLFVKLKGSLDSAISSYLTSKVSSLISDITPIVTIGLTLYITCYGYMILAGRVQQPFSDFLVKSVKIVFIAALALNAGNYSHYVIDSITGLQSGLASSLGVTGADPFKQLDQTLGAGLGIMKAYLDKLTGLGITDVVPALEYIIAACIAMIGILFLVLTGGYILIVADIFLKIVFAVGPLFIACLIWSPTARFFDMWFSQVLTYVLKAVFVSIALGFGVKIYQAQFNQITLGDSADQQNFFFVVIQILVIGYSLYKVMLEVNNLAAGLAGGMAASTMGIGQMYKAARIPLNNFSYGNRGAKENNGPSSNAVSQWSPSWRQSNHIRGLS